MLARWKHRSGISIPPDVFIPQAEKSGLIIPLPRQLMARAAKDLSPLIGRLHPQSTSAWPIFVLASLRSTISGNFCFLFHRAALTWLLKSPSGGLLPSFLTWRSYSIRFVIRESGLLWMISEQDIPVWDI